jgi:hypothetical protein
MLEFDTSKQIPVEGFCNDDDKITGYTTAGNDFSSLILVQQELACN